MEGVEKKPIRQTWQGHLVRFAPYITGGTILILLPPFLPVYVQSLMTKTLIFAIFAMSLNLLMGYTGLFSLGHAAYFGAGGYAIGVLAVRYHIHSLWIGAPLAILITGLVAAVLGTIALRLSGIYFLLITFALGQLLFSVAWKLKWLKSSGVEGIAGIPKPDLGIPWFTWDTSSFYYFVFLVFVLCFFLLYRGTSAPFGLTLKGIRECESRMQSLGYHTWLHRYITFIIAGMFAGVAGVLFSYHNGLIIPAHFGVVTSTLAMLMVIIGGAGTLFGPVIGAAVIVFVEFFSSVYAPERWPLILGAVFIASVMYLRGGIGPHLLALWKKGSHRYGSPKG